MKILIIGGAGFVGANLVRFCLRQPGAEITVLDSLEPKLRADTGNLRSVMNSIRFVRGSLLDEPLLAELVAGPEIVFNCAAQSSHPLSIQEPLFDVEINCLGNVKLLEALRQRNRQAVVVYASSSTVIGRAVGEVVDESHGEKPLDIYSANKGVAEKYYRIYHKVHDLKTVVLRFANLYGPYGKPFPEFGFVNYFIHVARTPSKLGLRAGIPIPVGAFDAHWDAIGAGISEGDIVNVVGTSTCIMAIAKEVDLIPGVCGVVKGSIHPCYYGIEAGLSATGDIFDAIARRAGTTVAALSKEVERFRAGQTGLLRLTWDNGDRTVLVNAELGGITLGWNLTHTPADELFAAIEGTAFHTRIILERMSEHGVPIRRVINGGGVPQKNETLNRVYANVLGKPVLVPQDEVTSLGSAIFAFLAAGVFRTIEEAQQALCPKYRTVEPDPRESAVYERLYPLYHRLYFGFGRLASEPAAIGDVLPQLRKIAAETRA